MVAAAALRLATARCLLCLRCVWLQLHLSLTYCSSCSGLPCNPNEPSPAPALRRSFTSSSARLSSSAARQALPHPLIATHAILQELVTEAPSISEDAVQLMKFHGSYMQDDREKRTFGAGKSYQFMMRTRQPSGTVTNQLYLVMDELADLVIELRGCTSHLGVLTAAPLNTACSCKVSVRQRVFGWLCFLTFFFCCPAFHCYSTAMARCDSQHAKPSSCMAC